MYSTPTGYDVVARNGFIGDQQILRQESIFMSMGINIDNTAADDITAFTGSGLPMSNTEELVDAVYEIDQIYATYEGDGIPTSASAGMLVPPLAANNSVRTGWWSSGISDASGAITASLAVTLSQAHTSALTIYLDGPNVTAGSVVFSNNGVTEEVALRCHMGLAVAPGNHEFDALVINITSIDKPYHHARIVEIEFGDSMTIGTSILTNQVTFIDEIDPLGQGIPMQELDFDLINVDGSYDEDNPDTLSTRLTIGNPINLSYTLYGNGRKFTVPMGRFLIADKRATEKTVRVTAYDVRWSLSRMYNEWSIDTSEDLGTSIHRILSAVEIGHLVDASVSEIYPTASYSFTDSTSILDDLQRVAEAYGLTVTPNRNGTIIIGTEYAEDDYGELPPHIQFSWPESSLMHRYNYIVVSYSGGQVSTDLRSGVNTERIVLSVSNPLIATQAHAQAVMARVISRLYSKAVSVQWAGDPAIDLYDSIDVYSMWTLNQTPTTYRVVKRELVFDGMLKETATLVNAN